MTDHFKDNHDSNGEPTKSFKEQILAELRDAHRLRRMREKELFATESHDNEVRDVDISESPSQTESSLGETAKYRLLSELEEAHRLNQMSEAEIGDDSNNWGETTDETLVSSSSSVTDAENLYDNIIPLNDDWAEHAQPVAGQMSFDLEDTISLEPLSETVATSHSEGMLDLDHLEIPDDEEHLGVASVMAGFRKLFEGDGQKTPEESIKSEGIDHQEETGYSDTVEENQNYTDQERLETEKGDEDMSHLKRQQRQRTNHIARKISLGLFSVLTVLILATGFFVYRYVDSGIKPLDAKATDYIQVEIPSGSGNKLIGKILEDSGVIKSGQIFNYYAKFKNYTDFKSGYYNLQKSMSLDEIAQKLQEGGTAVPERPALGKILIPEGYTLEQIAKAITANANTADKKDKTPFSEADFMALVQDETFIARMAEKFPNLLANLPSANDVRYRLEGYLFPATYSYYKETTLEDIVEEMLATMDANLSPFYTSIANSGMTVNQVLTLASLVEKEGATDDDRKLIAGVFYNRWNQGMPLQSNIAILYAMGKLGQPTTLLEDATIDTGIDSPYNIYVNPGLMPGPVDSPSLSAITATLNPEQSNYLYFVADVTTGAVYYATNYDEHSANVEKYINSQLAKDN